MQIKLYQTFKANGLRLSHFGFSFSRSLCFCCSSSMIVIESFVASECLQPVAYLNTAIQRHLYPSEATFFFLLWPILRFVPSESLRSGLQLHGIAVTCSGRSVYSYSLWDMHTGDKYKRVYALRTRTIKTELAWVWSNSSCSPHIVHICGYGPLTTIISAVMNAEKEKKQPQHRTYGQRMKTMNGMHINALWRLSICHTFDSIVSIVNAMRKMESLFGTNRR